MLTLVVVGVRPACPRLSSVPRHCWCLSLRSTGSSFDCKGAYILEILPVLARSELKFYIANKAQRK